MQTIEEHYKQEEKFKKRKPEQRHEELTEGLTVERKKIHYENDDTFSTDQKAIIELKQRVARLEEVLLKKSSEEVNEFKEVKEQVAFLKVEHEGYVSRLLNGLKNLQNKKETEVLLLNKEIKGLQQELAYKQQEMKALQLEVNDLKENRQSVLTIDRAYQALQDRFQTLQDTHQKLKERHQALHERSQELDQECFLLKERLWELSQYYNHLKEENEEEKKEIIALKEELNTERERTASLVSYYQSQEHQSQQKIEKLTQTANYLIRVNNALRNRGLQGQRLPIQGFIQNPYPLNLRQNPTVNLLNQVPQGLNQLQQLQQLQQLWQFNWLKNRLQQNSMFQNPMLNEQNQMTQDHQAVLSPSKRGPNQDFNTESSPLSDGRHVIFKPKPQRLEKPNSPVNAPNTMSNQSNNY